MSKGRSTTEPTERRDDATPLHVWFRRADHSPVGSGYLAFAAVLTAPIVGLIAGKYAGCPQQATGAAHVALSAVVGVPAGLGLGTLAMIVQSLGIPPMRTERSSRTIRRVVERAGIAAVYGTFITATAAIAALGANDQSCSPDLLEMFGNGATWGTLAGLGISLPTLIRSISADLLEARSGNGRIEMVRTLAVGIVLATLTACIYTSGLLHGSGWPK
ncbi:hypothetical protein [Rugosimonospora africana]|uniref:hypothetical protein n=1 Tax=Rugosimonospora africana TaxID=556532 RepID=UPI00194497EE|nr:hypothetical protein [Rugosimonospora africana]